MVMDRLKSSLSPPLAIFPHLARECVRTAAVPNGHCAVPIPPHNAQPRRDRRAKAENGLGGARRLRGHARRAHDRRGWISGLSGTNTVHADLLLINGRIWPGGPARHMEEALAVVGGRVLAVGRTADLMPLAGPDTRVIDLRGRTAIPGFNDAHAHPITLGLHGTRIDVSPRAV